MIHTQITSAKKRDWGRWAQYLMEWARMTVKFVSSLLQRIYSLVHMEKTGNKCAIHSSYLTDNHKHLDASTENSPSLKRSSEPFSLPEVPSVPSQNQGNEYGSTPFLPSSVKNPIKEMTNQFHSNLNYYSTPSTIPKSRIDFHRER